MNNIIDRIVVPNSILIFDLDGTLVDTDYANFVSYAEAVAEVMPFAEKLLYNPNRRFTRDSIKLILGNITKQEFDRIIEIKNQKYEYYLPQTILNRRIADILEANATTHTTILLTNCQRQRAEATLRYHGLINKFSYLFYCHDMKPCDIDKYTYVLDSLQLEPINVVVFENDLEEIKYACRAGIPVGNIFFTHKNESYESF